MQNALNFKTQTELLISTRNAVSSLWQELQQLNTTGFALANMKINAEIDNRILEIKEKFADAGEAGKQRANQLIYLLNLIRERRKELAYIEESKRIGEIQQTLKEEMKKQSDNMIKIFLSLNLNTMFKEKYVPPPAIERKTLPTIDAIESRAGNFIPTQATVEYEKQTASNTKAMVNLLSRQSPVGGTLNILGIGY